MTAAGWGYDGIGAGAGAACCERERGGGWESVQLWCHGHSGRTLPEAAGARLMAGAAAPKPAPGSGSRAEMGAAVAAAMRAGLPSRPTGMTRKISSARLG